MRLTPDFPFESYVRKRGVDFSKLYTALVLHEHIIAYSNLYHYIEESKSLMRKGKYTHESLGKCLEGIEKYYSHITMKQQIEIISRSVISTFVDEDFDYIRELLPGHNDIIDKYVFTPVHIEWVTEKLQSIFQQFYNYIKILGEMEQQIAYSFMNLYSPFPVKNKVKNTGKVLKVISAWGNTTLRDPFSGSIMGPPESDLIFECMAHVLNYLDVAYSLYTSMLSSAESIHQAFSEISTKFVVMERDLYNELRPLDPSTDHVFKNYYELELKSMNATYDLTISPNSNSPTFNDMVKRVEETINKHAALTLKKEGRCLITWNQPDVEEYPSTFLTTALDHYRFLLAAKI